MACAVHPRRTRDRTGENDVSETKQAIGELALFGGEPSFGENLYVGRPNIGDRARLMERIEGVLDRRWMTNNGPLVQELESRLAAYLNVKHCILMCNATVALEIVIRAAGMKGEVIVPSFTFVATAHALQWQQITPVFADVDPRTHCLDPDTVERMITPNTTGIIGVHLWGQPCNVEQLTEIARRRNLTLLFDAAHAFGSSHKGQMVGSFGDAEVFSFHATKFFNTFEGGAVTTNSDELATKIRLMKNFGFAGFDNVIYIGTNGKMTEMSAAMGLTSLESVDEFIAANRANHLLYQEQLSGLPGVRVLRYDEEEKNNYQYVVVEIDESAAGVSRDAIVRALHAEKVIARRYFYPGCHRMEPYRSFFPHAGMLLPQTERLCDAVMLLPNGTTVADADIRRITALVRLMIENGEELRRRDAELQKAAGAAS